MIDDWHNAGACAHCGANIEMRPKRAQGSITIAGLEPMEYRHIGDKSSSCSITQTFSVRPYSEWNKRKEWDKQEEAPHD